MKKVLVCIFALMTFVYATAQVKKTTKTTAKPAANKIVFKNLLDSFSYAAGCNVANNMKAQKINKINSAMMQKGIDDMYKSKQSQLDQAQMGAVMQRQLDAFNKEAAAPEIAKGVAFLAKNKLRKEVTTLPSGLQYEILKKSDTSTVKAKEGDGVIVNYIGTLISGTEFENSYKKGQPAEFAVSNQVIKGWEEILQYMCAGDKFKVYIPTELGYYLSPRDPKQIPPGAALIFEIALEQIKPNPAQ